MISTRCLKFLNVLDITIIKYYSICKFLHSIGILVKILNSALRAVMYFNKESIYLYLSVYQKKLQKVQRATSMHVMSITTSDTQGK